MKMLSRFFGGIRSTANKKEVQDRAKIAEDVLFGQVSGNDIEAIKAVAEVVSSLCDNQTEGVFDGGVFVFFKIKNESGNFQVFSKRLTVQERAIINEKPTIMADPYQLLQNLEVAKAISREKTLELREIAGREPSPPLPAA